jgi:RimJ/RimL family protein N-acetyltransferase
MAMIWDRVVVPLDVIAGHGAVPGVIRTRRLDLVEMSCPLVSAVLHEDWPAVQRLLGAPFPIEWRADGWHWLEPQLKNGEIDERYIAWGTRLALPTRNGVGADRGPVLAEVGFHGPPGSDGWVEIGYRVVSEHRRQGLAEEAVRALLSWAAAHGATGVKASVGPDNAASIGLLRKLGFAAAGAQVHPLLGEQLVFRRNARTQSHTDAESGHEALM